MEVFDKLEIVGGCIGNEWKRPPARLATHLGCNLPNLSTSHGGPGCRTRMVTVNFPILTGIKLGQQ